MVARLTHERSLWLTGENGQVVNIDDEYPDSVENRRSPDARLAAPLAPHSEQPGHLRFDASTPWPLLEQADRGLKDPRLAMLVPQPVQMIGLRHERGICAPAYDRGADPPRLDPAEVGEDGVRERRPHELDLEVIDLDAAQHDQAGGADRPPRVSGGGRSRREAVVSSVQATAFPAFGRQAGHQARSWR